MDDTYFQTGNDIFPRITKKAKFSPENADLYRSKVANAAPLKHTAVDLLSRLAALPLTDEMTRRDLYDIAGTVIGRYINAAIFEAEYLYVTDAPIAKLDRTMQIGLELMKTMADLLGSHEDYSLYESLLRLQSVTETNPNFEQTLKNNAECGYCRAYIYENAAYLYVPEMELLFSEVKRAAISGSSLNNQTIETGMAEIRDRYFATPLMAMKGTAVSYQKTVMRAAELLDRLEL